MNPKALIAASLVILAMLIYPVVTAADDGHTDLPRTVDVWAEPTCVAPYEVSIIHGKVTEDGTPAANISVFFRTDFGCLIDNRSMTYTTMTNESGLANVRFFAEKSGTATVTAAEKTGESNKTVVVVNAAASSSGNGGSSSGNGGTTPTPTPMVSPMATPGVNVTPTASPSPTTASIVATPTLSPMASPTETPLTTATPTPTPSATSEPLIHGFEAVFAIAAGLLAIAYLVLRRKRK